MTPDERAIVFRLLDDYSRNKHRCFVAEFFPDKVGTDYHVCFRPMRGDINSPNRYACRYVDISAQEVAEAGDRKELPVSVTALLDKELPSLGVLV